MLRDLGWLKQVKLQNSSGTVINPATVEKLDELKTALQNIYDAVDELEITTENINIEAGQIQLNTDELETKVQSVRDQLDVLLSTRASEATLGTVKTALDNIKTVLDTISSNAATETTLLNVYSAIDTVETKLQTIIDTLDVELSTRASEATLSEIKESIGQESGITVLSRLYEISSELDVALSTRASETTVANIYGQLNITLSTLRDAIIGTSPNNKTLQDIYDVLALIKTKTDNLDVALSTRATEATLALIKAKTDNLDVLLSSRLAENTFTGRIGEVQASPTQYTLLGRLKDLWDKLVELFETGIGKIKIWDGTNQAGIDNQNHIYVAGKSAIGIAPSGNPVSISGIDGSGLKRALKTDSTGRLETISPTAAALANIPIQLCVDKLLIAVNNGEWQEVLEYTVPSGYDFNSIGFNAISTVANEAAKAIFKLNLGSFVGATNTFTDGESWTLPRFAAKCYLYVTTAIGANNDLITITYTNQDGIAGRTATATLPKNSLVGTRIEAFLQTGDFGITDVTNVTHSQIGQVGNFNLEGNLCLFNQTLTAANTQYDSPIPPLNAIVVPEGGKVYLQYLANSGSNVRRGINLQGSLAPR